MVDTSITREVMRVELPILQARSDRAGWVVRWDDPSLELTVSFIHRKTGLPFILKGQFSGYKGLPPEWEFVDPITGEDGSASAYPSPPTPTPGGGPPLFISAGKRGRVICLPCNRLAYGTHSGPHNDWSITNWMTPEPRYLTVCEMVDRIHTELQASAGPWAPRRVAP